MSNAANAGKKQRIQLAFELVDLLESGEYVHIATLTSATENLLGKYHKELCEPDKGWISDEEIEILPKLLRMLAKEVEDEEGMQI